MGPSASLRSMTDLCEESEDPSSRIAHVKQKWTQLFLQKMVPTFAHPSAPSFPQPLTQDAKDLLPQLEGQQVGAAC
jgi:hypothetical protein